MIEALKKPLINIFRTAQAVLVKTPIKKIPGLPALSRRIFKIIWGGQNIIEIQGSEMFVDLNHRNPAMQRTFQAYAMNKVHEKSTTDLFNRFLKPGATVVDLGANIGYFSLLSAKIVGPRGKVFAFEPEPENFKYLSKNKELNGYRHLNALQKAASDKDGWISLFVCPYDSGHHTINNPAGIETYKKYGGEKVEEIKIEAVSLDKFLKDKTNKVDFMKIDVEGAEALAIKGAKETLKNNKNIIVIMEFFPYFIKAMGNSPEKLINFLLKDLGFNIFIVGGDYDMENSQANFIPVKSYGELSSFITEETGHVNLILSRRPMA